jgi:hypothetical protein
MRLFIELDIFEAACKDLLGQEGSLPITSDNYQFIPMELSDLHPRLPHEPSHLDEVTGMSLRPLLFFRKTRVSVRFLIGPRGCFSIMQGQDKRRRETRLRELISSRSPFPDFSECPLCNE